MANRTYRIITAAFHDPDIFDGEHTHAKIKLDIKVITKISYNYSLI